MSTTQATRIDYIEMNVTDIARAKKFYGEVFGWSFSDYGDSYCEFDHGAGKGGFALSDSTTPQGGPLVVLYSHDLDNTAERITAAGGIISTPTFDFPGGRRFHFQDLEGYELAAWSDKAPA